MPYPNFAQLQEYKKSLTRDERVLEQKWADEYIQVLSDFMGDSVTIKAAMDPDIAVVSGTLKSPVNVPSISYSAGHWYARLPGDSKTFDPYLEYQVPKSKQFCQTYCLMYLVGALPLVIPRNSWSKYYTYTYEALKFMKKVTDSLPSSSPAFKGETTRGPRRPKGDINKRIVECMKRPYMCVNVIG